jgi:hypothetical protein
MIAAPSRITHIFAAPYSALAHIAEGDPGASVRLSKRDDSFDPLPEQIRHHAQNQSHFDA